MSSIIAVVFLLFLPTCLVAWKEYDYFSNPTDKWKQLDRRGHSLVLMNESQVILFGGRGNDKHRPHVPQTFELVEIEGVLEFATHDNKPLSSDYIGPNNPRWYFQPIQRGFRAIMSSPNSAENAGVILVDILSKQGGH